MDTKCEGFFFLLSRGEMKKKTRGITYIARNNKFNKPLHVYINQYQYFSQIISIL